MRGQLTAARAATVAAAILALAATAAWAPAAPSASRTPRSAGRTAPSAGRQARPRPAAATVAKLLGNASHQRAIALPPSFAVGNGPDWLALDRATSTLYATNQNDNSVSVVDVARCNSKDLSGCGHKVDTVKVGASPQAIALDTATGTAYATNNNGNSISVIDIRTCNAVNHSGCGQTPATLKDPRGPITLAVDGATDTLYVTDIGVNTSGGQHTVSVFNAATCNGQRHSGCAQKPATIDVQPGPDGVVIDDATHTVYTVNVGKNDGHTVSVINAATCNGRRHSGCGQKTPSINIGLGPFWIALDQGSHTAYTANFNADSVSVINTATCNAIRHSGCGQRTATVPVGFAPWSITVDTALHTVFVANNHDDTMSAINAATCNASRRSGCHHRPAASQLGGAPQALLTDGATGTIYAANFVDGTVSVIDAARCDASHTRRCRHLAPAAPVGPFPSGAVVNRATGTLYVTDGTHTLSVISTAACNVHRRSGCTRHTAAARTGLFPGVLDLDRATGTVYVANSGDGTVSVINGATCNAHRHYGCGQKAPKIKVGGTPFALAVDQATDTVYVTNGFNSDGSPGRTVSVINGATCNAHRHSGCGQKPAQVSVGTGPLGLAVNQVTDTVYVANTFAGQNGTVSVINGAACNSGNHSSCGHKPVTTKVGPFPFGLAVNQATNAIYVANNNNGDGPASLSVIDGATCDGTNTSGCGTAWPALPGIGRAPTAAVFDASTHTVYTANFSDAAVSVVNVAPAAIHHPADRPPMVATGSAPFGIAIDRVTRTIYVCNDVDGTISILSEQPVRASANNPLWAIPPTAASVRLNHGGGLSMRPVLAGKSR
jgi:DNA-binding beta-propeller fold protein YncE